MSRRGRISYQLLLPQESISGVIVEGSADAGSAGSFATAASLLRINLK